jgi:serine/threonine protein phosphatase PrpC
LLCTDGLTDVVEDEEIIQAVRGQDLPAAAQALVDLACAHNTKDNITVVLLLVPWQAILKKT